MSKNVAVFVDVANIFYAAKAAGVDIDYVTLLKSASAGRDLVRAYAYTGLDPENENQRNFHAFLARHGYRVVSKDIRKYGDGKVKANLDIELVVDMMKTARNLDIAIVVSGDGDFAPAIRAVQEMGVRVEVISFRGNTSSDLIDVADQFTDITQLAKVEKGSSRSGRRVAGDEADLSMTEVPDKQTEGAGGRSRGGRGRGRGRTTEPAVEVTASRDRDRSARPIVALPGEKLSRASDAPEAAEEPAEAEPIAARLDEVEEAEEGGPRRRRRRGGRGRGRGRGRLEGELVAGDDRNGAASLEEDLIEAPAVPSAPRSTPFGSVWDSQLGTTRPATPSTTPFDEEDLDEPEIPEYLIAEQRRDRSGGRGRGGARGGRGAYASAIERERYGRGGGGGINRYPDVGGREHDRGRGRSGGSFGRSERAPARSGGGSEPWSEVPPELEAALRAQLASKPRGGGRGEGEPRGAESFGRGPVDASALSPAAEGAPADEAAPAEAPTRRGRGGSRRAVAEAAAEVALPEAPVEAPDGGEAAGAPAETVEPAAPKRRTTRRRTAEADVAPPADAAPAADADVAAPAPTRRRTTRKTAAAATEGASGEAGEAPADGGEAAPKRRTRRTTAASAEPAAEGAAEPAAAPRRRTTRRTAADGEPS